MLRIRSYFALASMNGKLIAVGGDQSARLGENANSVECYDPFKNKWEFIAPMNIQRYAHSVVVHGDRLYAIGGACGCGTLDSIEYYDPAIDKWTMVLKFI